MPLTPSTLGLFIAYMFQHQYAPPTASTYVSALGYFHRLAGAPDPSKVFWVMEMLKGYKKLGIRIDSRVADAGARLPAASPFAAFGYHISTDLRRCYCIYLISAPYYFVI